MKSPKRKSRRKSPKRKSRRKSRRKSPKRKSPKRKSPKRKSRRKSPSDRWDVYTMDGCPWCEKAEELLLNKGKNYTSSVGVGNPIVEKKMKEAGRTDYKYWPKIFHNDKFIGGYSDLEKRLK